MKKFFSLIAGVAAVVFLVCSAQKAQAQDMELFVNQARLINLSSPAATVFVAEPKIATYQVITPTKLLVFGRGPGLTSFMVLDENGSPINNTNIHVSYNTVLMRAALEREFPSLKLKLTPTADGVVVSGEVPSAQIAADVLALLDSYVNVATGASASSTPSASENDTDTTRTEVPDDDLSGPGLGTGTLAARAGKVINRLTITMPTQVVIRVRIAEVNRSVSDKLGINWFWRKAGTWGSTSFAFGLADTAVTSSSSFISDLTPDFSALIEALASENLVSVLAEPNLAVTSGETASFLAGGEIPFPTTSNNGGTGVEYKAFGVMLNVTPTILSENRISLRVRPEVSDVNEAIGSSIMGTTVPGFSIRRAETTIEVASGQSFVIGGLLQNNIKNAVSKIPGMGDLPVLGALFRSSGFEREETELVLIATAYVGQPSGGNLRIPNANIVIPGVFERLFLDKQPTVVSGPLRPDDLIYY